MPLNSPSKSFFSPNDELSFWEKIQDIKDLEL
jgi:hypothetical protein